MTVKSAQFADLEDAYPLSKLQAGMLFHSAYNPEVDVAIYHDIFSYHLKAVFDLAALQAAVQRLVARHPVLRTAFDLNSFARPLQLVRRTVDIPIQVEDIRALAADQQSAVLVAWREAEKQRPFDWTQPPLLRFYVHRRSSETFQFTVSFHHAILDGWSVASMLTELFQVYLAVLGRDVPAHKPSSATTFRDYIALEQKALESAEQRAYWTEQIKDHIVLNLPRWPATGPKNELRQVLRHNVPFSTELSNGLKQLAQSAGVPLKSVLLASHLWVLSRISNQVDVLTGLVSNGRPEEAGGERVLGLFLNTLPFRLKFQGGTWLDLVQATYRAEQEMLPFRRYPLAELQKMSDGRPLFETVFNFIHFHVYQGLSEFSEIQSLGGDAYEETNFTLTSNFSQTPGSSQISLILMYDATALHEKQVRAWGEYYRRALTAMARNPLEHYTAYSVLSKEEQQQLLVEWNDTQAAYAQDWCAHQIFEKQADSAPAATAVVFAGGRLTYGELNERANQLAHHLRALGVGPEVPVGVCMERSPEMIVGVLAILKAGGAYVPFDPAYPTERLAFTLADARINLLLTQQPLVTRLSGTSAQIICVDTFMAAEVTGYSRENPVIELTPENLAYIIYTSGSTGRPKGVAVQHRGLLNLIAWHHRVYEITAADRATLIASPAFDASVWELWPYLTAGASLYIPDDNTRAIPAELVAWLAEQGITIAFLPTPLAEASLAEAWPDQPVLRILLTGGDRLHHYPRSGLPFTLVNNYGPTENTVVATWAPLSSDTGIGTPPPIGRPIDNTQIYLLDTQGQPVPVGVPGELHIGGDSLARGYLGCSDLTAEKFIPNPFSREPGARLYKSGDLARYLPDGNIDFLGRIDHQVKVRGFRIELGEIESTLLQHPDIRETVVIVYQAEPASGERGAVEPARLVAYVVPQLNRTLAVGELRHFLQARLPEYMVPAAFVTLAELPLTPNGKVDQRALPTLDTARPELEKAFVAPGTSLERSLAEIWSQVLHLERVGIHDNFIELGGDSILGLQIAARANRLGLQITPRLLFENQTIAELAAVVSAADNVQAEQGLVTGPVPLTPIQHWFFEQNLLDPHYFNQSAMFQVPASLEPRLIEQAFQQVLRHHDALRLRFMQKDAGWQQINAGVDGAAILTQIDLSALPPAQQRVALEAAAAALQASLRLNEQLLRVDLFVLGAGRSNRLLIAIHHLVVDGVSWRILLEDLQSAYQQLSHGEAVQLPPKTTSFKRWAEQATQYAQAEALEREAEYWLTKAQLSARPLPRDYTSPNGSTQAAARTISVELDSEETGVLLQQVPATYRTEINHVLLTALTQAFARWTGEHSLWIDLEAHGREEIVETVDVSRTVGWFTAIFPVLLMLPGSDGVADAVAGIKDQLRSIPNRGVGYGMLRYLSRNADLIQQLRSLPQPEVSFNYLGQWDQTADDAGLFRPAPESSGSNHSARGERRHLLEVNGLVTGGQLRVNWTYSEKIHSQTTIAQLAQDFISALRNIIDHCQSGATSDYHPADFPDAGLTDEKLNKVFAELGLNSWED